MLSNVLKISGLGMLINCMVIKKSVSRFPAYVPIDMVLSVLTKFFLPSYGRFLSCMIYILFFGVGSPLVALKMLINDVINFPRDL